MLAENEKKSESTGLYGHALKRYIGRSFDEAKTTRDKLLTTHPDDGPTKTLLSRIEYLTQHPPADDWNGTWVMTKK